MLHRTRIRGVVSGRDVDQSPRLSRANESSTHHPPLLPARSAPRTNRIVHQNGGYCALGGAPTAVDLCGRLQPRFEGSNSGGGRSRREGVLRGTYAGGLGGGPDSTGDRLRQGAHHRRSLDSGAFQTFSERTCGRRDGSNLLRSGVMWNCCGAVHHSSSQYGPSNIDPYSLTDGFPPRYPRAT